MPTTSADRAVRALGRRLLRASPSVLRVLAGPPRRNDRGDPLDLATQVMLRLEGLAGAALDRPSAEEARAQFRRSMALAAPDPVAVTTEDATVPGPRGPVPVRHYRPVGHNLPVVVYLHGGGWAVGDVDSYDPLCRTLAVEGPFHVLSVDYALAPEHPFPLGLCDALAAVDAATAAHGPVSVAGDSAGGHYAALIAKQRDLVAQILIYPATDLRRQTASHRTLAHGYLLEKEGIDRYLAWLGAEPTDPDASPALAPPGPAPAVVVTAGFDPLRDEGELYVHALREAGVEVDHLAFPGFVHGFVNMDGLLPSARKGLDTILQSMRHVCRRRDTV